MNRDEKWAHAWRALEKIYVAVRGEKGEQKILNEQRNFSIHPALVYYSLFQSIQPECAAKGISLDALTESIAYMSMDEYTNNPLGDGYLYAYFRLASTEGKSIGEKIAQARADAGLTQAKLAEKIGVTQKDVSRWETGERSPGIQNRKKLADIFACDINDLT